MSAASVAMLPAQNLARLADSLHYKVELQATLSSGDHSPLWLNANRYGLSSVEPRYGYLRGAVERPLSADDGRRWGVGYGLDLFGGANVRGYGGSGLKGPLVQQAYVEARWLKMVLTVGSKQQPMELKNQSLSSGSQVLGINARPVPQVRLLLPDYWTVPFTRSWVAVKGHVAYGKTTDDNWQESFTQGQSKYTRDALYHSKAGYLRIGKPGKPLSVELGLEMACQFGGQSYTNHDSDSYRWVDNGSGVKDFFAALIPGQGGETVEDMYRNSEGNHLGSWQARVNLDYPKWALGVYAEHFYEDQSSMFFLDYDGYGTGTDWDKKQKSRFFLYDPKDALLGAELRLKDLSWLNTVLLEYVYTKYQSGPIYHDHTQNINTHISGRDNYYNHYIFTGWQHWGMVMGNPLYRSPLYNDNGEIVVQNNRFVAWHLGLSGQPTARLGYRVLATTQKGYGTYFKLYREPRTSVSLMAEAAYALPQGWSVKGAVGYDHGDIYGDQTGFQLTVAKTGLLKLTSKH